MAVQKIEQYRMRNGKDILKVILKPTRVFPEGSNYFYTDAEAISLVQSRGWNLVKSGNRVVVVAKSYNGIDLFHQELCIFYHGVEANYIDHINHCEADNIDDNLNIVSNQQNLLNKFTRGYTLSKNQSKLAFLPQIISNKKVYHPFSQVNREDECCVQQYYAEQVILKKMMKDEFYQFNFLNYRRGELDLLDLERRGIISEEEAIYHHILKYAENPWYMLRYGLEEYYKENNIPIPEYDLDEQGFMVDKITRKKLCPFYKD